MDVSLVLTHDCNLGCTYCYMGEKFRRAMSIETVRAALDLGFADDAEKLQVSFFGGEPTLAWDMLVRATGEAQRRAVERGKQLVLTVTTNGTLLDREKVAFLVDNNFFIGFSIDGDRAAHDATRPSKGGKPSFDRVLAGLDLCLEAGAWLETISVIDPANVAHLGGTVEFLVERGVERLALNPNFSAAWSDEELARWQAGYEAAARLYVARHRAGTPVYINVLDDKIVTHIKGGYSASDQCKMGHGSVAVAPSGNLYPCERMVEEDRDQTLCIGHVSTGISPARHAALDGQQGVENDDCGGCSVKGRCMSFCACANRAETGHIGTPGGVQCWHEQMTLAVADAAGNELWRARDRHFLARVYGFVEERTCAG